ncbi:MAG: O-antigen ligase family protein [Bacteroidales bacterium]|nr:O-antigen ligase family protein [Bacteroidales bacterium]
MTSLQIHHSLYVLLMAAVCVAIPLSNYMMSMMLIFVAANWLIEGDFKAKWERLKENKSAVFAFFFLFVMFLGFIRASDYGVALDYWTSKLAMFLAPLIIASSKSFKPKELNFVLACFVLSVFFATVYSVAYYATHEVVDIREISVFISHIRFSLCIDLAIVLLLYFAFREKDMPFALRLLAVVLSVWLLIYLFIAQTLTGIVLLFLVAVVYMVYILLCHWKEKTYRWISVGMLCMVAAFVAQVGIVTWNYFHVDQSQYAKVADVTVNGNPYVNERNSMVENGSLIGMYICESELERTWKQRSDVDFRNPELESTLVRYLNSCHLRKDSAGVMALSAQDVRNIEQGIANVAYTSRFGLKRALYPIFFSIELYQSSGDVQNSTIFQRVEYWRASWQLVKEHWLLGVGLGNHKTAVGEQLRRDGSRLSGKERTGCHNQWLTLWLMGGIAVPLAFLFLLLYPFIEQKRKMSFVYVAFFIIIVGSMFTEDTLETEAGLTLFAIMNSLLLYGFNQNHYENA